MSQRKTGSEASGSGSAAAAFVAAGIGALAMGTLTVLTAFGLLAAPVLYPPVGGLSGKVAIAMGIWVIAWAGLHFRWSRQGIDLGRIRAPTLVMTGLGVLGTSLPFVLR